MTPLPSDAWLAAVVVCLCLSLFASGVAFGYCLAMYPRRDD